MIQPRTQTQTYWVNDFALTESDLEQIYNHFLEVEQPQTADQLARVIMHHRSAEERNEIKRRLSGRSIYQPKNTYKEGDELVFPAMQFTHGTVTDTRSGQNPQDGRFTVLTVKMNGKSREFAAGLNTDHILNHGADATFDVLNVNTIDELHRLYGSTVADGITTALNESENFVRLGKDWFIKDLMLEVNIGHLHLAEAVLEMHEGGPLPPDEIRVHLDLDPSASPEVQNFSLNYALLNDHRFDEVAPRGHIGWFLHRLQPTGVRETPDRLKYSPIPYDRALLSPQLLLLERELDDEWSDLEPSITPQPVVLTLTYAHRAAGTLPLSARTRPLFPPSNSSRQRVVLIDEYTGEEIVTWVVQHERYVYGLKAWYETNGVPVGGFVSLRPGYQPGTVYLNCDRRRGQREWVRLASVVESRIKFDLHRRTISCGYDDLLIIGTDFVSAIDALWKKSESGKRSIASLLAELFPELAGLNPQNTVHAKTLYSAINMFRRMPPGPLFAELVRNPAFQSVGDHYWQFDRSRWTG